MIRKPLKLSQGAFLCPKVKFLTLYIPVVVFLLLFCCSVSSSNKNNNKKYEYIKRTNQAETAQDFKGLDLSLP